MKEIRVKRVVTDKELMQFIKFPWKVYAGDQYWVPPLIMDRKKILDRKKNPFFEHAEMEMFLAEQDNQIVGRIAAIKNDLHNKEHNDKAGFWGFFECINDQSVANALFDTAIDWLKKKGCDKTFGPANPSSNDEYGMLIEGFDDEPRILMTYNPRYYLELCDNYGFRKAKDLNAYKLENKKVAGSEKLKRVAEIATKRSGIQITSLNMKDFDREVAKVKYVYNKAWAANWGFVPMTDHELDHMAKDLKQLINPKIVLFGQIKDEVVGFSLCLPDYNQIFKKMNGRLFPFGIFRLLFGKKSITWSRVITLGIIPEYQKRGLDAVFYYETLNRAHNEGIDLGEASWILEDNAMMNRGAQVMQGDLYKKYRIYEKNI
ncbi:MAG: hypothetical protein WCJ01_01245 [Ignavibacteria bacterium]